MDSLNIALKKTKVDTVKAETYLEMSYQALMNGDIDKGLLIVDTAENIAKKAKWNIGITTAHRYKANMYTAKGDNVNALKFFKLSLKESEKNKDSLGVILSNYSIGAIYQRESNLPKATEYFLKGIDLSKQINSDDQMAMGYYSISVILFIQFDLNKSKEYVNRALAIFNRKQDADYVYWQAQAYEILGTVYLKEKKNDSAIYYFNKSLEKNKAANFVEGIGRLNVQLTSAYENNPKIQLQYTEEATKIFEAYGDNLYKIYNDGNRGLVYKNLYFHPELIKTLPDSLQLSKSEFATKADYYLNYAINKSRELKYSDLEIQFLKPYAQLLADQKKYAKAIEYYEAFVTLNDSVYSQDLKNQIAGLESKREIETRDKQLQINQLQLDKNRSERIILFCGLAALLIIGTLLYYQNRTRKKTNDTLRKLNAELDKANQLKARFFGILSHDLRSPIASLVNYLQLQENSTENLPAEIRNECNLQIKNSANDLLNNMESLLTWSKSQMQNFNPQKRQVSVDDLYAYIQKFYSESNINYIKIHYQNVENITINTDENYLQTIMYNLTANAVKALKDTENAEIIWNAKREHNEIVLSIADNGSGIKSEQVENLYTEKTTANTKTGFGLHIIRDLANAIQCKIVHENNIPNGTIFKLYL
jgi:signal transduction histidine kinase/tetratricopeptide (TPR) repeat protein